MVFARFGFSWNFRLSYPRLRQALSRYRQFYYKSVENKIITIKKLENGRYFIDLHKYLINFIISFIFIFPIIFFSSKNIILASICVIVFWIFISIIMEINDFVGKKVHDKIFNKNIFKDLLQKKFQIEKIGNYKGLLIEKNGRTIRIFYNWNP